MGPNDHLSGISAPPYHLWLKSPLREYHRGVSLAQLVSLKDDAASKQGCKWHIWQPVQAGCKIDKTGCCGSIHHHAKRSLALLFQVGGWDCQNLHDVIVITKKTEHRKKDRRRARYPRYCSPWGQHCWDGHRWGRPTVQILGEVWYWYPLVN